MKLTFEKVRYKNFLATGNDFTEVLLDVAPTTLILGSNGAGKTSFVDALTFAIFGKPFRDTNKPLLVNSINQANCIVEVEFSVGTKKYKVIRGIKPNVFEIYCNGILKEQDSKSLDYQEYLEKEVLKLNFKSYKQIIALGAGDFVPFMELNAADRRLVVESILDIQVFSTMATIAKKRIAVNDEAIKTVTREIKVVEGKVQLQRDNIESNTKRNNDKIEENNIEIKGYEDRIIIHQTEIGSLEGTIVMKQNELDELIKSSVKEKHTKLLKIETKLEQNIIRIEKEIEFFSENSICPSCKQSIDLTIKDMQIDQNRCRHEELIGGQSKLEEELARLSNSLLEIDRLTREISQLGMQISDKNTRICQFKVWIKRLSEDNTRLEAIVFDEEHSNATLTAFLMEKEQLEKQFNTLREDKKYLDLSGLFLKDTGIKTGIIKHYLPSINRYINEYLSYMDFYVNFTLNENFDEVILSRYRDSFLYGSFSNGEKLRLNLALLFTWRKIANLKNSIDTNILIMDEIVDSASIDAQGLDDIFKLIYSLTGTNVFVISPKGDPMADRFQKIIRFVKKNNFSEIQQ